MSQLPAETEIDPNSIDLEGGHTLTIRRAGAGSDLTLRARNGATVLQIRVTEAGPVLTVQGDLAVEADGDLDLAGEHVSIRGREGVSLASEGDLDLQARGDLSSVAREQVIRARLGNVALQANDDVTAHGERIRLNC